MMLRAATLLLALLSGPAALAFESTAAGPLEEVIVSGYREKPRQQNLSSISLLDQATIDSASIEHFEELVPLVPNMSFSGEGSRARYFQLRGIGEREQYEGAPNPSVGFFVDDIDLSGLGGISSTFDMAQAEILRGPQSVRFGASALAGAVYLRSTAPAQETSARAELTVGNDSLWAAGAALGGAIGPDLSARISLHRQQSDGFRRNVYTRSATSSRDELTARAGLLWTFAGGWQASLSSLFADFDNGYDAWTVNNDEIVHSDHPGRDAQRTAAGSLRVEGPLSPALDFASITSIASSDVLFSFDGDWGNDGFWQKYGDYLYDYRYQNPRQRDTIGQELRLLSTPESSMFGGTTDWVVGAYLHRLDEDNQIDSTGLYDDRNEENFCAPCLTDRQISSSYRADTWAIFASTQSRVTERFDLSTGLRLEYWSAVYGDQWQDINYPNEPPTGSSCTRFDCSPDEHLWGGHLEFGLRISSRTRAYLRMARGFKSGGFNPSLAALQGVAVLGAELISYDPETLWNYELGLKGLWLDDRLAVDLSAFLADRDDAQLSQSSQQVAFDPNSFVFVTYNGAARVRGLEATVTWALNGQWELHAALGLMDSEIKYSNNTALVSPDAIGRSLAHAPDYNLNVGVSYFHADGWHGRLDVNAADRFYFDVSHNQQASARQVVNLRVGKSWHDWSLALWVRNLFDEDYPTRGFYFGNEPPGFQNTLYTRFGDPRSWGITLGYALGQ